MAKQTSEPETWRNFDDSPLTLLLRHDTWGPETAIPLICDIDPKQSELFSAEVYYGTPLIEKALRPESLEYWRIRLLSDRRNNSPRCWYANVDEYCDACADWETTQKQ